jgi:hypothetical protein
VVKAVYLLSAVKVDLLISVNPTERELDLLPCGSKVDEFVLHTQAVNLRIDWLVLLALVDGEVHDAARRVLMGLSLKWPVGSYALP